MTAQIKTTFVITLLSWFCVCFFFSCCPNPTVGTNSKAWKTPNGKIKILSTTSMIDDLVGKIGGDHVDGYTLIKGELDPHSYQLVKGDDEKLAFADLIFYNGLGLEHGPSLQHYLVVSPKAVSLGDKIADQYPELILRFGGQVDPHIWMDVSLWSKTVPLIVKALSEKDPEHAGEYQANGAALVKQMLEVHDDIKRQLQAIPSEKRYLVTSHDAFNYFTRTYLAEENEKTSEEWQKRFMAPEGLAPDSQLSSTEIQNLINHLAKYKIRVLFGESNLSKDSIRKIVQAGKEKGLQLTIADVFLYADAMGAPGSDGDTYMKMIEHNAKAIAHQLGSSQNE